MIVIVPKRSTACALTVTTTTRLNTPPSARGSYSTRCRALHRRFSFHAPNRQGRPSGLKHQEGLAGDPAVGAGLVSPPSDCIRRSVLPLCRLRPDVSGPPSLTPCVSEIVRQTPPRSLTAPVWQRAGSPDSGGHRVKLGSLSAAPGSNILSLPKHLAGVGLMCLLSCLKQTRWGAGPGPVVIDREWCVLTWRIGVGLGERSTSLDGR